jgi:hypothetical protein
MDNLSTVQLYECSLTAPQSAGGMPAQDAGILNTKAIDYTGRKHAV